MHHITCKQSVRLRLPNTLVESRRPLWRSAENDFGQPSIPPWYRGMRLARRQRILGIMFPLNGTSTNAISVAVIHHPFTIFVVDEVDTDALYWASEKLQGREESNGQRDPAPGSSSREGCILTKAAQEDDGHDRDRVRVIWPNHLGGQEL